MVITFDLQPIKVEAGRHATDAVIGFEYHRAMPVARQLIRNGQAHRACTQHGDSLPARLFSCHT